MYFVIFFVFIGLVVWFVKAPLFRYGAFYIVSFISLISLVLYSYLFSYNNKFKKKYLNYLFLFSLVFFVFKNIDRIVKSNKSFLPETVFKFDGNDESFEFLGNEKVKILKPNGRLCYYSYYLCSHEVHKGIKIIEHGNYFITRY